MAKTTISIHRSTKKELTKIGNKGESYDDIVQKLVKSYKEYDENK